MRLTSQARKGLRCLALPGIGLGEYKFLFFSVEQKWALLPVNQVDTKVGISIVCRAQRGSLLLCWGRKGTLLLSRGQKGGHYYFVKSTTVGVITMWGHYCYESRNGAILLLCVEHK